MIRMDCKHEFVCEQRLELPVSRSRFWPCGRKVKQTTAIQTKQFPAAVSYETSRRMGLAIRPPPLLGSPWLLSRAQGLAACSKQEDSYENVLCGLGPGHSHGRPDIRHVG
jgi:hypothetical protein